ncbi:DUF4232 domain-containing protein [Streptomyces sp. NPDC047072]|uniref:DUF4232 domain-containing protein n=1 Tax=Streptomyces sp. NPDC047072 TaxID=3154809 RepID=UPI0033C207CA
MSVRTRRTRRTRVLAAAVIAAAALSLTACNSGEGVHDEGASQVVAATAAPTAATPPAKTKAKADEGTSTVGGQDGTAGLTSTGSKKGTGGTGGTSGGGTTGSTGSSGTTGSQGSSARNSSAKGASGAVDSDDSESILNPCTTATTKVTATQVARPLNHMLLTVTNRGSKNCDLVYYPAVDFGDAQSVPPVIEDSQPQAVVTLAPGESGYAGIILSAADGSGSDGRTAKTLDVWFNDNAGHATPSLPADGVYVDSSLQVTYWQYSMDDALAW